MDFLSANLLLTFQNCSKIAILLSKIDFLSANSRFPKWRDVSTANNEGSLYSWTTKWILSHHPWTSSTALSNFLWLKEIVKKGGRRNSEHKNTFYEREFKSVCNWITFLEHQLSSLLQYTAVYEKSIIIKKEHELWLLFHDLIYV